MTMTLEHPTSQTTCHPPTIDREAIFDRKRAERDAGIDGLMEAAKAKGETLERFIAAIEWDSVHAPKSTNLRQLAEIGIHPPAADALGDEDLPAALTLVIDGLAALGVYLSGTDHLADRKLYSVLTTKVLLDEIRDIPPNDDMSEFIDMSAIQPDTVKGRRKQSAPYLVIVNRDASLPRPKRMTDAERPAA